MAAPPTESQTIASQPSSSTPSQQPEDIGTRDPETLERAAELGIVLPPSDLYSDEPPLESYQHLQQLLLLLKCLDWLWRDRTDYFAAGNLTVYDNARRLKTQELSRAGFFSGKKTANTPMSLSNGCPTPPPR